MFLLLYMGVSVHAWILIVTIYISEAWWRWLRNTVIAVDGVECVCVGAEWWDPVHIPTADVSIYL